MLVPITFDIAGEAQYQRAFDILEHEARDLSEPLRDSADVIKRSVNQQFFTEGAYGGTPWAPLSPGYRAEKDAEFPGRPILVRTAQMRGELTTDRAIKRLDHRRLEYGSDLDRAYWHQVGAGNLPARKIIALTAQDRRSIDRAFAEWINHRRRGAFAATR